MASQGKSGYERVSTYHCWIEGGMYNVTVFDYVYMVWYVR